MGIETAIILAGVAAAAGSTAGAAMSSSAAEKGAELQAGAVNTATKAQTQANEEALAFQKQQAEQNYQAQAIAQKANYDQWAAQRADRSTLGQMYGLPALTTPAFQPTPDPNYTGTGAGPTTPLPASTTTPTSGPTTPGSTPSGATNLTPTEQQVIATMKSIGLTPSGPGSGIGDYQYWAQQAQAEGTGWTPEWVNRLTGRFKSGGGGTNAPASASAQTAAQPQSPGTLASLYTSPMSGGNYLPTLYAPPGVRPTNPNQQPQPYAPPQNTLGSMYLGY